MVASRRFFASPDILSSLIENGEYESALSHAKQHNLDTDPIYKSRWAKSDMGFSGIQENLQFIRDKKWVVNECLQRVCTSVEGMSALISYGLRETDVYGSSVESDTRVVEDAFYLIARLRLLQYKDRLDTFLGIHMGRFSQRRYTIFRSINLLKVAKSFAEDGKTGALELLIKRHAYTLAPNYLHILDAIPETLSPHAYVNILPEYSPPKLFLPRRSQDWCENEHVLHILQSTGLAAGDEVSIHECTDFVIKLLNGLVWPKEDEITAWYLQRAQDIDKLSGQLENSLFLLDTGMQKGIKGLDALWKDVAELCMVSFSNAELEDAEKLSLEAWEAMDDYDKFKTMLKGVNEETVVDRLLDVAVPFTQKLKEKKDSYLVRYLKEISATNLKLCAAVFDEASKRSYREVLFKDDEDMINAGLACIYGTTQNDQWETMAFILSKMPVDDDKEDDKDPRRRFLRYGRSSDTGYPREASRRDSSRSEELEEKFRQAKGLVQAGKFLFHYQVPTTIEFLVSSNEDLKATKQMLRILLSKFSRRHPSRSDGEWSMLWRDLNILQEKAFTFLEKEYILLEFCRGLLKSGKFNLASSYLRNPLLSTEKVESLVVQTAREYFYSANSIDSPDIDRAKECLNLLPASATANAEFDIIIAITEKLPYLGVSLLPAQFRQIKDPMDVLKMAIESHKGIEVSELVEELYEVARLLGFKSESELSVVEEALAREAAAYGEVGIAQDLCLRLARKNHGKIWDLCVAIARGPEAEKLDLASRKELIGFALRHCDDESISELLNAWKEFDSADSDEYSSVQLVEEPDEPEDEAAVEEDSTSSIVLDENDETQKISQEMPSESSETTTSVKTPIERSNEIIRKEFGDVLTDADITSIDAAFRCFSRLVESTSSKEQATSLKLLLDEWEPIFNENEFQPQDENVKAEKTDEEGEDWGDGWQEFEVGDTTVLSKLHSFWRLTLEKLVQYESLDIALNTLDKRFSESVVLINEEEAGEILEYTARRSVSSATKLTLLLPYESLTSTYLRRLEDELQRQAGDVDSVLLVLILWARHLSSIARDPSLNGLFTFLCNVVGLSEPCLGVTLPFFIAELTRNRHYGVAASLVMQHMRVPLSFSTWNVSHFAIKRYLEAQQSQQRQRRAEKLDLEQLDETLISYIPEAYSRLVYSFEIVATEALNTLKI